LRAVGAAPSTVFSTLRATSLRVAYDFHPLLLSIQSLNFVYRIKVESISVDSDHEWACKLPIAVGFLFNGVS